MVTVAATQTKTKKTFRSGNSLFDDPLQFASTFLRVINKQQQLVPLVYKPVQRHWLANRTRRDLILKFRQPGISTAVQAELSRRAWTSTASTATLSHQNSTTQRFRRMVDRFYNNLPEEVRPVRHYNNSTVSTYPDFDSEAIIATAGSEDVGRGFTSSHLHGCLSPETPIVCAQTRQLKRMGDFQIGDRVITHTGGIGQVTYISRQHKPAFKVLLRGLRQFPLIATGEHRFWTRSGWRELSTLHSGDEIGYPIPVIRSGGIEWAFRLPDSARPQGGGRRESGPDTVLPTYELGRVLGLYLAEGCIIKQSKTPNHPSGVTFAVHEKEVQRTEEWLNAIRELFTSYRVSADAISKTVRITVYGRSFASFVQYLCGERDEKRLPIMWAECGTKFVRGLVHGYFAGDGHFSAARDRRVSASSIRSAITIGMRDALAALGYGWASVEHQPAAVRHGHNEQAQWIIRLGGAGVIQLSEELSKPYVPMQYPKKGFRSICVEDGYAWLPIQQINPMGITEVMDFEVNHDDHSYCTIHGATHNSEVAFWKNADQIMAGIMQSVPRNGIIILESTANGAQGWFYERVMEALSGDPTWNLLFYPWWSDPTDPDYYIPLEPGEILKYEPDEAELVRQHGLTPEQVKFRRVKQRELGWLFPQEYPEDPYSCFITSGQAFFGMLDDAAWYTPDDTIIPPSHRIVAGLDFGQKNDFTVLSILDATTRKQIGLFRWNRMSWEDMRRLIRSECYQHQVSLLVAEENSIGGPNIEELRKEFDAAPGMECAVVAFQTTHASKQMIMGDMHIALHEDGWQLIDTPEQRNEIRIFQSEQLPSGRWRYSAPEGAHDDIVMADAFAIHAARRMRVPEYA